MNKLTRDNAEAITAIDAQRTNDHRAEDAGQAQAAPHGKQFKIVSTGGDYLACQVFNGTKAVGDGVYIAKPYHLRRSTLDGKSSGGWSFSYTANEARTATKSGEDDIDQTVEPGYVAGEIILARFVAGGCGITTSSAHGSEVCYWVDVNNDARGWVYEC